MPVTVHVPDMMCETCAATIRQAVAAVEGVESVAVDVAAKAVVVEGPVEATAVAEAIRAAGFTPEA